MITLRVGAAYTLRAIVTNRSTRAGVGVAADLTVHVRVPVAGSLLLDESLNMIVGAGLSETFSFAFTPTIAGNGEIQAWVHPTTRPDLTLAAKFEPMEVVAAAPAPGPAPGPSASIGPGLIWFAGLEGWQWIGDIPEIPVATDIYLAPEWMNISTAPVVGHINLYITPPAGGVLTPAAIQNQDKSANPGNGWFVAFAPFQADEPGVYEIQADILVGDARQAWTNYELTAR